MSDNTTSLKAAYHTLGCKLNFSETSTIGRILASRGIVRAGETERPDIIVVNTCSVTEMADKKGRQLVRRLAREWPDATIVVTGCYAQLKPEQAASLPGVAIVLGSNEKLRISQYIDRWLETRTQQVVTTPPLEIREFMPSCERGDRTRYFLKVQDGCDYFCTYCTIPFARGRSRSGDIAELTEMARKAGEAGAREIVITGVNIGEFGRDNGQSFFDLLRRLDDIESISRYRISSIEPNLLTEEILRWIASDSRAFMPHFHVPLQSGSDRVLKLMNRRYDTRLFASRMELIKSLMPDAFIGVDVIAGARGETPEEWQRSYDFIATLPITRLHVFPYSERPGTKALLLGDAVENGERHRRVGRLIELSDRRLAEFMESMTGTERPVLWEHAVKTPLAPGEDPSAPRTSMMSGLTDNYLRVEAPLRPELINTITTCRLAGPHPTKRETMTAENAGV